MRRLFFTLIGLLALSRAWAFEPFTVANIVPEGLQRISTGTLFNYLPISVGERVDQQRIEQAMHKLFATGFFNDIEIARSGEDLVIRVEERPSIASINISGNETIPSDALVEHLKAAGLYEGNIFNRSILERIQQVLQSQYFNMGRYSVQVSTEVESLARNRVALSIEVAEGEIATIKQIILIGNQRFSSEELLDQLDLAAEEESSIFGGDDQYSKQALAGDIEKIRSFYQDRGFLDFAIDYTNVSISTDRRDVYITIALREGEQYRVKSVSVSGETVIGQARVRELITVQPGEIFSRKQVSESSALISDALGEQGFAFVNINPIPELDKANNEVGLNFFIDPGRRTYVRRINITGNSKTRDEVIRREIRQMEGATIDMAKVKRSQTRIQRLGFFESANVETLAVPGRPDQVDLNYSVVERPSGTLIASIGYSQVQKWIFSAQVSQDNFLGTGNKVSFKIDNSQATEVYEFSFFNPYYTLNGVSRGYSLFQQKTDAGAVNISNYQTDTLGGRLYYGIPINEYARMRLGVEAKETDLIIGDQAAPSVEAFRDDFGTNVEALTLETSWIHDTRDLTIFANTGAYNSIGLEAATPAGDLEYYRVSYTHRSHAQLGGGYGFGFKTQIGYGDGYGNMDRLPFFERFFVGGARSVRGFQGNSLGPQETITFTTLDENGDPVLDENGDPVTSSYTRPVGGDLKLVLNFELVPPLFEENKATRLSFFIDGGNVFNTKETTLDASGNEVPWKFDADDLRWSYGVSFAWLSPVGPLTFSLAEPFKYDEQLDSLQRFQFTIGVPF